MTHSYKWRKNFKPHKFTTMPKMPKKPRKPKRTASVTSWERFDQRMKDWEKRKNDIKNAAKKKESLIKKYSHY